MREKYFYNLVLLTPAIVTLFVSDKLIDPFNIGKLTTLTICALLLLVFFPQKLLNLNVLSQNKFLLISLIFFLVFHLVTIVLSSQNFYRGLIGAWGRNNGLLSYVGLSIILFCTSQYVAKFGDLKLVKVLVYFGFFETIYGFMQWQNADIFQFSYIGSPIILTLGNENFSSLFLVLCLLATIYLASIEKSDPKKLGFFAMSFCQLLVVYLMDTAQSRLALVLSAAIFMIVKLKSIRNSNLRAKLYILIGLITTAILTILGVIGIGLFSFINNNLGSLYSRYLHWIAAWKMFQKNFLYGVGIDSYGDFQPFFRVLDQNGIPDTYSNNAHSLFFQLLSTGGILLFLSFISMLVYFGLALIRFLLDKDFSQNKKIFYLCAMVTMSMNIVISIDNIALNVWFWSFMGAIMGLSSNYSVNSTFRKNDYSNITNKNNVWFRLSSSVIGATLFVGIFFCLRTVYIEFNLRGSLVEIQSGVNRPEALNDLYSLSLNLTDPDIRMIAITKLYESGENDRAYELTTSALKDYPRNLRLLYSAFVYNQQYGNREEAQKLISKLNNLDPLNVEFRKLLEDF